MNQGIGILIHGRHVEAKAWESLVWGQAPRKLGALPMMILVALNRGPENIKTIVFGTGASEKEGLLESEYMKRYLLESFWRLDDFEQIDNHDQLDSLSELYVGLVPKIICETTSKNTVEEIAAAAKIFTEAGVTEVIQITSASHAPRCIKDAAVAAEQGLIPADQLWYVVRDQSTYAGMKAGDVAIFEPPHRGDDPMINAPLLPHQVFPSLYKIKSMEDKVTALREIESVIARAIAQQDS